MRPDRGPHRRHPVEIAGVADLTFTVEHPPATASAAASSGPTAGTGLLTGTVARDRGGHAVGAASSAAGPGRSRVAGVARRGRALAPSRRSLRPGRRPPTAPQARSRCSTSQVHAQPHGQRGRRTRAAAWAVATRAGHQRPADRGACRTALQRREGERHGDHASRAPGAMRGPAPAGQRRPRSDAGRAGGRAAPTRTARVRLPASRVGGDVAQVVDQQDGAGQQPDRHRRPPRPATAPARAARRPTRTSPRSRRRPAPRPRPAPTRRRAWARRCTGRRRRSRPPPTTSSRGRRPRPAPARPARPRANESQRRPLDRGRGGQSDAVSRTGPMRSVSTPRTPSE